MDAYTDADTDPNTQIDTYVQEPHPGECNGKGPGPEGHSRQKRYTEETVRFVFMNAYRDTDIDADANADKMR